MLEPKELPDLRAPALSKCSTTRQNEKEVTAVDFGYILELPGEH